MNGTPTNVEELLEYSFKYLGGRPLTSMEIHFKLTGIKSTGPITKEIKSLLRLKAIKRTSVSVNGVLIPFYSKPK
ncbi:MAG TPA: hypothetical protein ENI23_15375 [bacterium]|nr:hypothetical protein [bacterium]